jgi:PPIC-type PPIASE domain
LFFRLPLGWTPRSGDDSLKVAPSPNIHSAGKSVKLLRDPFLHFVVAGAFLFAGYAIINRGDITVSEADPIRIREGEVHWLEQTFANQWQRTATEAEFCGLIAGLVEEELFAREARVLGLDENDTIVRRRLAQKLGFLVDDTSRILGPPDAELRRFYEANGESFRSVGRISFTQLFFDPQRRTHPEADAEAALVSISGTARDGSGALGDRILLETEFHGVGEQAVAGMFGADFAQSIFAIKPGHWAGPVKSGYGVHLVRVNEVKPAAIRPFEEVRAKVLAEWRHRQEKELRAAYVAKLRAKYGVVVDDSVRRLLEPNAGASVP